MFRCSPFRTGSTEITGIEGTTPVRSQSIKPWSARLSFSEVTQDLGKELRHYKSGNAGMEEIGQLAQELDLLLSVAASHPDVQEHSDQELFEKATAWCQCFVAQCNTAKQAGLLPPSRNTNIPNSQANKSTAKIESAKPFSRAVLRGGGPKGQAYGGSLMFLEHAKILDGLKEVAGSSAGSMCAAFLACGCDATQFAYEILNKDMLDLCNTHKDYEALIKNGEGVFDLQLVNGWMTAKMPILNTGQDMVVYLNAQLKHMVLEKLKGLEEKDSLKPLVTKLNTSNSMITFGDLKTLVEVHPGAFKHLHMASYDQITKSVIYFKSNNNEFLELPIAIACRCSGSLPVVFKPCNLQYKEKSFRFIDGGVVTNVPLESFSGSTHRNYMNDLQSNPPQSPAPTQEKDLLSQTLVLTFADQGQSFSKLHESNYAQYSKESAINKIASKRKSLLEQDRQIDIEKLRLSGPNVLVLEHGELSTSSFNAKKIQKIQAQMEGLLSTARFYGQRFDQGIAT